jgi:hypothetical protein
MQHAGQHFLVVESSTSSFLAELGKRRVISKGPLLIQLRSTMLRYLKSLYAQQ